MATKTTLDNLLEAANMIESIQGDSLDDDQSRHSNSSEGEKRAQMRDNFNTLQDLLPQLAGQRKASNVSILKEATGEIKKLNDDAEVYQSEKAKLASHKECQLAKLRLLEGSGGASILNGDCQIGVAASNRATASTIGHTDASFQPVASKKNPYVVKQCTHTAEVGVNTDFTEDLVIDEEEWGKDTTDLHIDIED